MPSSPRITLPCSASASTPLNPLGTVGDQLTNNPISSLIPSLVTLPNPSPIAASATFSFLSCNSLILCSTVSFTTSLRTITSFVCPNLCTLSNAWCSTAAFHHMSTEITRLACVRLRPTPPARREVSMMLQSVSCLKRFRASSRCLRDAPPVYRTVSCPESSQIRSTRSSILT
jgi:hypothetical protein